MLYIFANLHKVKILTILLACLRTEYITWWNIGWRNGAGKREIEIVVVVAGAKEESKRIMLPKHAHIFTKLFHCCLQVECMVHTLFTRWQCNSPCIFDRTVSLGVTLWFGSLTIRRIMSAQKNVYLQHRY